RSTRRHGVSRTKKKFTEPVALSSPRPTDLPLARTTSRLGFDLLAPRARCKGQSRRHLMGPQVPPRAKRPQFALNELSTYPRLPRRPGDNPRPEGDGRPESGRWARQAVQLTT